MVFLVAAMAAVVALFWIWLQGILRIRSAMPPGPMPIPILGNIPQLGIDQDKAHLALFELTKRYGPIMTVLCGSVPVIVLSSPALVNEALNKRGANYSSRPYLMLAVDVLSYGGKNLGFSPYGEHWRKVRRIAHQVLNVRAVKSLTAFVDIETQGLVQTLLKSSGKEVYPRRLFKRLSFNVMCRVCFGMVYGEGLDDPEFQEAMYLNESLFALAGPQPINFFPWMRHVPILNRPVKAGQELLPRRDAYLNKQIDRIRQRMKKAPAVPEALELAEKERRLCFTEGVLAHQEAEGLSDIEVMLLVGDLLVAGLDTISSSLEWACALLVNNPHVIQNLHEELDRTVGTRMPDENDIPNLPYLKAVVMETWRLKPVVPMGIPHCTSGPDVLEGYTIPENVMVALNIYGISHDAKLFPDPERFIPERFTNPPIPIQGAEFMQNDPANLYPFGAGRRICVGMHLAHTEVYLALARMLHAFDIKSLHGPVDMTDAVGITLSPAKQSPIVFTKRQTAQDMRAG